MSEGDKKSEKVDFVRWFSELSNKDVGIAGGKGASLGEMYNNKFPIPPGFVVTAQAYRYFIEKTGIREDMEKSLEGLDINDTDALNEASKKVREIMEKEEFPKEMEDEILEAYEVLDVDKGKINSAGGGAMEILKNSHEPPFVAVRSSATAEDLADASFAGQQESFLNVKGNKGLMGKVKKCFSSLFTPRAIYYREKKGFDHFETALSAVVQKMIDSEKSGVMFSKNPVRDDNTVLVEAVWGLGEGIVSGRIKPDSYVVDRDIEKFDIKKAEISEKKVAIVRDSSGENTVVKLTSERAKQRVLSNYEIKRLAQYALQLEQHYGLPQDIEFAIENNEIYIVQSRPITTKASKVSGEEVSGTAILKGLGASPGVAAGPVKIIHDLSELSKVKKGDVLVTEMTNPDMVVAMQRSSAIVTDEGGLTSHASIVSREMGIPAVVGTGEATSKLKDGQVVTVDGNSGKVVEGRGETKAVEINPVVETKTKIKVIVDLPDFAERAAKSKCKAVGLTRLEGIIASSQKHPLKFVKEKNMEGYVEVIYKGLKKIAEPFEEIWVRSSDIRSDEYRNLEGAPKEVEGNPMLGDHGIRFSLRHPEIMKAELMAIKEVADDFPDKKIGIMMPQIISVSELKETKRIAREDVGIPKNVRIGIMVETPAAVQLINDFCEEGTDFISFGTNDLTQYTLAIDRNNGDVQYLYDETHPAVVSSIRYVIRRCKKYGVETSICGQAGSRPEMVKILVAEGIDSISVNADAAAKISEVVSKVESGGSEGEDEKKDNGGKESQEEKKEGSESENKEEVVEELNEISESGEGKIKSKEREEIIEEGDKLSDEEVHEALEDEENSAGGSKSVESAGEDVDIEEAILGELGDEGESQESSGEEYNPGSLGNKNADVPPLNEAIPVGSEDLNQGNGERELDFNEIIEENVEKEAEEALGVETEIGKEEKKKNEHIGKEWRPREDTSLDIF